MNQRNRMYILFILGIIIVICPAFTHEYEQGPRFENFGSGLAEQYDPYQDVSVSDWSYPYLLKLKQIGILSSENDIKFHPNQAVTREEAAYLLVKSLGGLDEEQEKKVSYEDVPSDHRLTPYVYEASQRGIFKGKTESQFGWGEELTRAQMAAIISRTYELTPTQESGFLDIPSDFWAGDAIDALVGTKITTGYEDQTFRPAQSTTRAQMAAFVVRALEHKEMLPELELPLEMMVSYVNNKYLHYHFEYWPWQEFEPVMNKANSYLDEGGHSRAEKLKMLVELYEADEQLEVREFDKSELQDLVDQVREMAENGDNYEPYLWDDLMAKTIKGIHYLRSDRALPIPYQETIEQIKQKVKNRPIPQKVKGMFYESVWSTMVVPKDKISVNFLEKQEKKDNGIITNHDQLEVIVPVEMDQLDFKDLKKDNYYVVTAEGEYDYINSKEFNFNDADYYTNEIEEHGSDTIVFGEEVTPQNIYDFLLSQEQVNEVGFYKETVDGSSMVKNDYLVYADKGFTYEIEYAKDWYANASLPYWEEFQEKYMNKSE